VLLPDPYSAYHPELCELPALIQQFQWRLLQLGEIARRSEIDSYNIARVTRVDPAIGEAGRRPGKTVEKLL
jgi:hypothetical protein